MINSALFHNYLSQELGLGPFLNARPVSGGDVNQAYQFNFDKGSVFLKYQPEASRHFFESEAYALRALCEQDIIAIAEPLLCASFEGEQFLVLKWISEGIRASNYASNLASGLAAIHRISADQFGWPQDNFIGTLAQSNLELSTWAEFYFYQRLERQFALAYDHGLTNSKDRKQLESLGRNLNSLLPAEKPALLHGNLWSGNAIANSLGLPVLIDPSSYFGHREMDLAMMKLFGGFEPEVFRQYQEQFPLEGAWEERIPIHQLYPLLVHLNLFGGSYLGSCRAIWQGFN